MKPYAHQVVGTDHVVRRRSSAIFDEPGMGKSKQVVDAAEKLFAAGEIDAIVVVCPASVQSVWDSATTGQVMQHTSYTEVPPMVLRFDARYKDFTIHRTAKKFVPLWVVTSYSYIRSKKNLTKILRELGDLRFLLVFDEVHFCKSRTSQQSKAAHKLRTKATRCAGLTGTPVAHDVTDLWSIFRAIDPEAIPEGYFEFRAEYANVVTRKMGNRTFQQIVGSKNLPALQKRLKPWVLLRKKEDCLDLPERTYAEVEVALPAGKVWDTYVSMRDEFVAEMENASASIALNPAVRVVRLSQITSGFVYGGRAMKCSTCLKLEEEHTIDDDCGSYPLRDPEWLHSAKVDAFLEWMKCQKLPVLAWGRFRAEIFAAAEQCTKEGLRTAVIMGGQSMRDREVIVDSFQNGLLDVVVGHPLAGGVGLTLTAASSAAYISNDYSYVGRDQSEGRVHRPGQRHPVTYTDFIATSPRGSRTIDHAILSILRRKINFAELTVGEWRSAVDGKMDIREKARPEVF